jgi:hypothetical protein
MKLINAALAEKNLRVKELSKELQDKIAQHKEMIIKYNLACEEYENEEEEDPELTKKLDEQEDFIASFEEEVAAEIKEYQKPVAQDPEPAIDPAPAPAQAAPEPKKDNSAGWLIFGGAVLLVTLGAVNIFKKK